MKRIATFVLTDLMLFVGSASAGPIHVGKALRKTATVVSMPARKPMGALKVTATGILAGIESVGVVVQAVGLGVEKAGVLIYDVGKAISGNSTPAPTVPAPTPAP